MRVRWLTAFLDFPAAEFGPEVAFWRALTGSTVSPPRGAQREFASLDPFHGDAHLRVQRVDDGPGGTHVDVHVDDPSTAADEAVRLGATLVARHETLAVLTSPAGGPFCLVPWEGELTRARPIRWPGGTISVIDRICFEVTGSDFDTEVAFWSELSGLAAPDTAGLDRYELTRDPALPLQVALYRGGGEPGRVDAHLDFAATDLPEEIERHEDWGAVVVDRHDDLVVMADPTGRRYFISERSPRTGR